MNTVLDACYVVSYSMVGSRSLRVYSGQCSDDLADDMALQLDAVPAILRMAIQPGSPYSMFLHCSLSTTRYGAATAADLAVSMRPADS